MTNPFYRSKAWKLAREEALARDGYLCQRCLKEHRLLTVADLVHHIKPLEDWPELALVLSNLLSLCSTCHNVIHDEKGRRPAPEPKRRARIIRL